MFKKITLIFLFSWLSLTSRSQAIVADAITGTWQTQDNTGLVVIYKNGNFYYGKIKNGKREEKLDIHNPDPTKRNNPLIGMVILQYFKFNGQNQWENGTVYDPGSGNTYRCIITLKDNNTLKLRGYIGISLIGRTEVWKRVE